MTNIIIGKTPFKLIYGLLGVLPIEIKIQTWNIILWEGVENRADLLIMQIRQIERCDEELPKMAVYVRN